MTPTPDLFTARDGFETGAIIEITSVISYSQKFLYTNVGYFLDVKDDELSISISPTLSVEKYADMYICLDEIKSLRLLTGTHRHWSWAPEWTTWCFESKLNGLIEFKDNWWGGNPDNWPKDEWSLTERPWWAPKGPNT